MRTDLRQILNKMSMIDPGVIYDTRHPSTLLNSVRYLSSDTYDKLKTSFI